MSRRPIWEARTGRDLERIPARDQSRVVAAVERYAETDYGDILRLQGVTPPTWRLRVGDYRVLFHIEDPAADDEDRREWLVIERVLHRREAYRS